MKNLLILPLIFLSFAHAETFQCKVVGVTDGDTITCLTDQKEQVKVRLYQIDAPESGQAYRQKAKQALSDMIYGLTVEVENKGTDRYKRMLGILRFDAWLAENMTAKSTLSLSKVSNVNLEMIKQGYAWYDPFTHNGNLKYKLAEQQARANKLGLWADNNPVAPWKWREEKNK